LVFDNENYALTTGQASPTTSLGAKTKTTPM
jgi:2-oxoglutarate ferredoxin oxidoreductase subunit beta